MFFWSLLKMFFLMPKNVFFDPSPCFSRSSDDRLGSFYLTAAAATARPSGAWCFSCWQRLFFEVSFARNFFFEQHNNNNKNTQTTRQAVLVLARGRRSGSSSSTRFSGMVFLIGWHERLFGRGFSSSGSSCGSSSGSSSSSSGSKQ